MYNSDLIKKAQSLAHPTKLSNECKSAEVGCALVTEKGNSYIGVCFDCACGLGTCAEHGAIQNMLAHRESRVMKIVAVCEDGTILPPCGRCRELLLQVNGKNLDTEIIVRRDKVSTLRELLPDPWQEKWK
jgi:cytidine deaminase